MPLVLTPTRELDLQGLRENIRAYEAEGFDGFIAFGCMGEFYAPNDREFEAIVDTAVTPQRPSLQFLGQLPKLQGNVFNERVMWMQQGATES